MELDTIPIAEIVPYEKNPRKNDKAVDIVAKSIKEFGFKVPIILDKDNVIVAGHTRLKAAQRLGITEVPVIWADDLTPEQVKAFRLMDNKSTEYADWNYELLKGELTELKGLGFNLELTGFSENELSNLVPEDIEEGELPDPEKPKYEVKQGDIYQLGTHRLMCGDSTKKEYVETLMNGQKADMVFTDPPYNVNYTGSPDKQRTFKNENMSDENFTEFLYKAFSNYALFTKKSAALFSCCAALSVREFINALEKAGYEITNQIIWKKDRTTFRVGNRMCYKWQYEPILFAIRDEPVHYHDIYHSSNVWEINAPIALGNRENGTNSTTGIHPTSKPIKLCATAIQNHSKTEDIVMDTFGGSGSTLIAAEQLNRTCYMLEIDPLYCSFIIERWENLTGKKAVKLT